MRWGLVDQVVEAHQPRHVEHTVVHLPSLGAPRDVGVQIEEQRVGGVVVQPSRSIVDPGAVADVAPFGVLEQRALQSQLHGRESIAHAFE